MLKLWFQQTLGRLQKIVLPSLLNLGSLLKHSALTDKASKEEGAHYATVD
jgi:hypothetical protein